MSSSLHVRYQVSPDYALRVLEYLNQGVSDDTVLAESVATLGFPPKLLVEQMRWLSKLGLVDSHKADRVPILSAEGSQLATIGQLRPSVAYEVLHCIHYCLWNPLKHNEYGFSWTYRTLCDELQNTTRLELDNKVLAEFLINRAIEEFGSDYKISLGPGSIRGVVQWLNRLTPPVVDGRYLTLRPLCPPETVLLAVQHVYQRNGYAVSDVIAIDERIKAEICRICLLDSSGFSQALETTAQVYQCIEWQSGWGEFVRLLHTVSFSDFIL